MLRLMLVELRKLMQMLFQVELKFKINVLSDWL